MTSSRKFDRLLQAGCLGLIGMLAAAGCGGSSGGGKKTDAGSPDVVPPDAVIPSVVNLTVSPQSVDLGTIDVGVKSTAVTVTVTNAGTVASGPLSVVPSGSGITATGCAGTALAPKATCTISITALVAVAGQISGTIEVGDTPANTKKIAVSGVAIAPGGFTLLPNALDLGDVRVGKSVSGTVTLTNTSPGGLAGVVVAVNGTGFADANPASCPSSLTVGQSCIVTVTYTAGSTSGPAKGGLTVSQGGVTRTVSLTANVQTPPKLVVTPLSASLQTVVGTPSAPVVFYVVNAGDVVSGLPTVAITGENKDDFSFTSTCAGTLAGGGAASCQVTVIYDPKAAPAISSKANLTVSETVGPSTATATLTGTAVPPSTLKITGASTDFGTIIVGGASPALTFTVTNEGDDSGAIKVSGDARFTIVTDNCSDKSLPGKGTCGFTAQFKPAEGDVGVVNGQLKAAGASVTNPAFLAVSGNAVPQAKLVIAPTSLEFGSLPTMQESAAQTLVISNNGGAPTGALKVENTGAQFKIKGDTCTGASLTAAGTTKSCSIIVTFTSTGTDTEATGKIIVTDTTGAAGSVSATLHGTGMAHPAIVMSPTHVCPQYQEDDPLCVPGNAYFGVQGHAVWGPAFANKVIGQSTPEMTFYIYNTTNPTLAPDSGDLTFEITGAAAADFAIVKNNCKDAPLVSTAAYETAPTSCVITLTFTPSAAGLRNALLTVKTSRGGISQTTLEGKGLSVVELQPINVAKTRTGLEFGQVPLGHNEAAKNTKPFRVWVRNTTLADLTSTVTVLLPTPNPADFVWPTSATNLTVFNGANDQSVGLLTPPIDHSGTSQLGPNGAGAPFLSAATSNPCASKTVSFAVGADKLPTDATKNGNAPYTYDVASGYWFCDFGVQFYPQSARGALSAELSASATGTGSSKINLTGTATGPLVISPSPALLQNPIAIGQSANSSTYLTLTITNAGAIEQKGLTFALGGTGSGDFQIAGTDCWGLEELPIDHAYTDLRAVTLPATVGSNYCHVWLGFEPKTEGPYAVTFTVTAANGAGTADDESATDTIIATGSKTFGPLTITPNPATASFADAPYKKADATPVTFTVRNTGTLDASTLTYAVTGDFERLPSEGVAGACSTSGSFVLAGGASCTIQVRAKPMPNAGLTTQPEGTKKKQMIGTLAVTSAPGGTVEVPLAYYETSSIMVRLKDTTTLVPALAYGFAPAGKGTPVDISFEVSNLGSSPITLAHTANGSMGSFSVREDAQVQNRCDFAANNTLAAGATCTLVVRNTNGTEGVIAPEWATELAIYESSNDLNRALISLSSVTLKAASMATYGIAANSHLDGSGVAVMDSAIDLGTVARGATRPTGGSATVWFVNNGQVPTGQLGFQWEITVDGTTGAPSEVADSEFIIEPNETAGCLNKVIQPQAVCSVTVHFKPAATRTSTAARTAKLSLVDAGTASAAVFFTATPEVVNSVRVGIAPQDSKDGFFQFTQVTPIYTSGTPVGEEVHTFVVTNNTGSSQNIAAPANSGGFVVQAAASNPCNGGSVDNGGSCQFNVVFRPTGATSMADLYRWATLSVTDGDSTTLTTLGLIGRVQQPATLQISQPVTVVDCSDAGDPNCTYLGVLSSGATKTVVLTVSNVGDVAMAAAPNGNGLLVTAEAVGTAYATYNVETNDCNGKRLAAAGNGDASKCTVTVRVTGASVTQHQDPQGLIKIGQAATGSAIQDPQVERNIYNCVYMAAAAQIEGNGIFDSAPVTGYTDREFIVWNGRAGERNSDDQSRYMPTGILTASITGTNADQFTIVGNALSPNLGLNPYDGSAEAAPRIRVRFAPNALVAANASFIATLNLFDAGVGSTPVKTVTLQGTPKPALSLDKPGSGTATPKTLVMAESSVPAEIFTVTLEDTAKATAPLKTSLDGADFMLIDDWCYGKILDATKSSCQVTVKYIGRTTSTAKTAILTVDGGDNGVALAGKSVAVKVSYTGAEAQQH